MRGGGKAGGGAGTGKAGQEDAGGGQKWGCTTKSVTTDAPGEEARSPVPCCWSGRLTPILCCPEDISVEDTWNSQMPEVFPACPTTHHLLLSCLALSAASLGAAWAGTEPARCLLVRTGCWVSGRDGQCHTTGTCNEVTVLHECSLLSWYWHRYFRWAFMDFRRVLCGCSCIPHQGVLIYVFYCNALLWQWGQTPPPCTCFVQFQTERRWMADSVPCCSSTARTMLPILLLRHQQPLPLAMSLAPDPPCHSHGLQTNLQLWAGEQQWDTNSPAEVSCHRFDEDIFSTTLKLIYLEVIWEKYKVRKGK